MLYAVFTQKVCFLIYAADPIVVKKEQDIKPGGKKQRMPERKSGRIVAAAKKKDCTRPGTVLMQMGDRNMFCYKDIPGHLSGDEVCDGVIICGGVRQ